MASSGNTTIQMYYSPTAGHVPAAANLASGELAVNTADGILYYKNANSVVSVLANSNVDSHLQWDSANSTLIVLSNGALEIPVGNTVQQPANAAVGMIRFNTSVSEFQGYNGTAWSQIGGGATGGGPDQVFVQNQAIVTTSYTLTTGYNAESVGPITINAGATVTIPAGQRWVVF